MRIFSNNDIRNKKVFLRVDLNVPMEDGTITDNNRIKAVIPTIKYLVGQQAKIIIGTHCGRPEGKKSDDTSIAPIAKELQRVLNLKVTMAPGIIGEEVKKVTDLMQPGGILVLENLRWDKREEKNDAQFAEELASLAEVYVNDAFAVSHRANASVEAITHYLPSFGGLLLQSEIENLSKIGKNPKLPFVLVIGGVKVKDKAGVLDKLAPLATTILLGGEVANTFLKAKGEDIGESLFDSEMVDNCKKILEEFGYKIILPMDFAREESDKSFKIMDIGEITQGKFATEIKKAKTIFWNGNMGYSEKPRYGKGMDAVARAIRECDGTTVVAGGNTVGYLIEHGLNQGITFLSTGGGAALEFLAGKELPGIKALEDDERKK